MGCSGSKNANAPAPTPGNAAEEKTVDEKALTFKVELVREEGQELGMVVTFPGKTCLSVKTLKEGGLVPSWNQQQTDKTEERIREGDMIMSINGVSGSSDQMMEELKKVGSLSLLVKRGEGVAPTAAPVAEAAPEGGPEKAADEPVAVAQQDEQAASASQPCEEPAPVVQSEEAGAGQQSEEPASAPKEEAASENVLQNALIADHDATDNIDVTAEPEELKPVESKTCGCF